MFLSQSIDRDPGSDFWYAPVAASTASGARVNQTTALQQSTVYKCVRAIAETIGMLPLPVYKRLERGKEKATKHPLYQLLMSPNQWQTGMQWREMMQGHASMRGNGYSQIVVGASGRVEALIPLHPDRMQVEVLDNGLPRYRYKDETGRERVFVFGEVLHLQGFAVDGYVGLNPIEAQREAIGGAIAIRDHGSRFFANSARPPSWIKFEGKFADDVARRKWSDQFQAAYGGSNSGRSPVLERGMELKSLAISNVDSQWLEAVQAREIDIAGIFRVPPHKIGVLGRATWGNIEHQALEFVTDCIMPWCVRWEQSLQRDLMFGEDYFPEFLIDMLLRGDTRTRYEAYGKGIQDGWLLRNEAREKENLNPLEGLDEPLEPLNMAPAGSRRAAQERGEKIDDSAAADARDPRPAIDARTLAIQTAAAERIARKESAALQRALRTPEPAAAIDAGYGEQHARFVGEVLVLDAERAAADSQAAAQYAKDLLASGQLAKLTTHEWESMRVAQLLKLGTEPDKPVTAREMLGLVRAVAQRNVNVAGPVVNLPEQAAPVVNVAGPVVNLPEQAAPVVNVAGPVVNLPEQAAPIVNVAQPNITVEAKPAPAEGVMQMQIVSMPDRVTQSTIERNPKGQIVHSSQTEKDA